MRFSPLFAFGAMYLCCIFAPNLHCEPADTTPTVIDPNIVSDPFTGANPEERDRKAFEEFQKGLGDLINTDPRAAAEQYNKFLTDHPNLRPSVGVDAASALGKLYANGLKDNKQAISTYDWAIGKFGNYPGTVSLINDKANLLAAENRADEAQKLYVDHLQQILHGWPQYANDPLDQYSRMLEAQGKSDEMIHLLGQFVVDQPAFLDPGPPNWDWVYDRITNALLKGNHQQEALGWAKLRFMVCAYDAGSIDRASRLLARVWTAAEPSKSNLEGFAAAQKDSAVHNPLADVNLPPLDQGILKDRLGWTGGSEHITAEILLGDLHGAMAEAREMQRKKETAKEGALQVCRVFKAGDLNLKRANAYLQFLKAGEGPNPVDDFLKEDAARTSPSKP